MSYFYICSDCGRGFTGEDPFKTGAANKMFKSVWQGGGPQAGAYSDDPIFRCPYCLSKNRTAGTERERSIYLREKHSYPAPDPRWPAVRAAQKYEDCDVNVIVAERTIRGMSGEAGQRLQKTMDACGWEISDDILQDMSAEFFHGVICFCPAEGTWYVYRKRRIVCAVRRGETDRDYLFSGDGLVFVKGEETGRKLLKTVNDAIADYSLMIRR